MSSRHTLMFTLSVALTALLSACGGGSTPDPSLQAFFQTQPSFDDNVPAGAQTITPQEFRTLVQGGATAITPEDLAREAAAQKAQDDQDTLDATQYIGQFPEFGNLLSGPDASAINADGDHRILVDTAGGAKAVTLLGNAFGRASLATHARTFPTRDNQARLYTQLYPDLQQALGFSPTQLGLPSPDSVTSLDQAAIVRYNKALGDVLINDRASIANLKYLLDPANLEVGAADQLDRTQTGACEAPTATGIYKNFDWPLKNLTTTVKDQGQRGTCWAFATVAALEAEIARRDHKLVNLSEQDYAANRFITWAPRTYGDGGDPIYIAQKASAANYTFALEKGWQYNKSNSRQSNDKTQTYTHSCDGYQDATHHVGPCSDTNFQGYLLTVPFGGHIYVIRSLPNTGSPSGYRMQSPTDFWDQGDKDRSMVILLLRSVLGHPTTITLDMRYVKPTANSAPSLSNMNPDANGYATRQTMQKKADGTDDFELDHVMTVTGFISSQNLHQTVPSAPIADDYGYFIVKNSWGDCWGDQGYVYLPWTWVSTFVGQASTGILPQ